MNNYVVTNIRLPEEDYLRLKEEAAKKRKSLSAVIREKVGQKRPDNYEKILLAPTDWFTERDYKDYKKMRSGLKKRARMYDW
ncbi:ribbon-helix-helix protein, CopG family [Candidatus Daviesbacteria bacterium]|nr:ribbon-helix-helix protein, CopG family [Candidatus Daviesbacteria bacterium]